MSTVKVTRVTAGLTHVEPKASTLHNITLKCEFSYNDDVEELVAEAGKQLRQYYAGCLRTLVNRNE
jgi:hypothetical protein